VLIGITGALRAFSTDFVTLSATVFLGGLLGPIIPLSLHKACGVWFSGRHLGLANGFVAGGMAFGFMVGAMVSATVLSPLLGGWRQVMIFYGLVAVLMCIPWALSRAAPDDESAARAGNTMSMRHTLSHVVRLKSVWILGLALLGIGGGVQGALGYLPLYLREIGWPGPSADGALATFHAMSLLMVFPIALLSDRLGSRKRFLMVAALMIVTGIGSLAFVPGPLVWAAVILSGLVRDGFMAIYMTMITELDGVGALYVGTAMGLSGTLSRVGGLMAPPLGNSLATYNLSLPFLFWAGMGLMGFVCLYFVKEGKRSEVEAEFVPVARSEYV
jgi:cyanate permease